ncbi:class I SAM-dependent DNA methyltransferase [Psychrobacter immobilis]|uniref:HsdM family class I SAM-dependent methyltransferase n=1 Tax=Psychrobacter immobilis TaxID=498 RepID=UPI0019192210|nr:N-6 DNA methylase [Psychrobacter immobilis]
MLIDAEKDLIASLGFNRAVSVHSNECTESEAIVLQQVKGLNVDLVYLNTDENGSSFPAIFLKKVSTFDSRALIEIAETQKDIWNYKKVLFLYVFSDTEIRIYNCAGKPILKAKQTDYDKELEGLEIGKYSLSNQQHLEELDKVFSRVAIDTGIVWKLEESDKIRTKMNLKRRVDRYLVDSLVETTKQLEVDGLSKDLIHKLILRSLFLLYLEDRGATDENLYQQINSKATCYFDILQNVEDTYHLYRKLETYFNGNVFTIKVDEMNLVTKEQLAVIRKCFTSGNEDTTQVDLFSEWRLFDFSIIQIELLSEIYERFLLESNPEQKKQSGTFYTPPSLVEFILNEKLPTGKSYTNYNVKILDPSCGSGIFLVESFKRLVKRYENHHGEKLTDFRKLKKLLTENIFGIEIESQSIRVATFSLYLALVDFLDPKTIWQKESHLLPDLINNPNDEILKVQGHNLFCRDTIEVNEEIENHEFDLIVGNPPFGIKQLLPSIREYCEKYNFAREMVLPFLHKAVDLAPHGEIALIFNTKILTNTSNTYQNFRKWLFNECYVEKVFNFSIFRKVPKSFGGHLFGDAVGPISIIYYQNQTPKNPSTQIEYIAPKTYVKSNVIEGLQIDRTDIKYLPRVECQNPNSKIWKIAMWGGIADWKLIQQLYSYENDIKSYANNHNIKYSVGLQPLGKSSNNPIEDNEISKMEFIRPESIERFYTNKNNFTHINTLLSNQDTIKHYLKLFSKDYLHELPAINIFRRVTGKEIFKGPILLAKEGFKQNKLCFSIVDTPVVFNSTVLGFSTPDIDKLRYLSGIFNSSLATYFLLLTSNSWGIERERIKPNEIYDLPIFEDTQISDEIIKLHKQIEAKIKDFSFEYVTLEKQLNNLVFKLFSIDEESKQSISDFIQFQADLFHNQSKSIALHSVQQNQIRDYSQVIANSLNAFIKDQNLYVNATIFDISHYSPLMMVKLSFSKEKETIHVSNENVSAQLKQLDEKLWEEKASNIYVRKILNYKSDDDILIVRPNQRRFWSKSMAMEDGSNLILEILNGV